MDEELKRYKEMINAAWKILYVFVNTKTDEDLLRLHWAASMISQKFNSEFMNDLISAVMKEIDRRAEVGTDKNKDRP